MLRSTPLHFVVTFFCIMRFVFDNEGESVECTGFFKSVLFWGPACNKVVCNVYVTFRNFTVSLTGGT